MKIACCQFDSQWGNVQGNMDFCDNLLKDYTAGDMDILVLPEMAFTGYVFKSVKEIYPYLEDAEVGPSVTWAKRQATRLQCHVMVGYPQKDGDTFYNSVCFVDPNGQVIKTYQKTFLYETDELWATEGPGFISFDTDTFGKVGLGICMDLNPEKFKADFYKHEFANFHVENETDIILCSMAWLKSKEKERDLLSTIKYWVLRLLPLNHTGKNTIFVACNRIGQERGSQFAGNSCILEFNDTNTTIIKHFSEEIGIMIADI